MLVMATFTWKNKGKVTFLILQSATGGARYWPGAVMAAITDGKALIINNDP